MRLLYTALLAVAIVTAVGCKSDKGKAEKVSVDVLLSRIKTEEKTVDDKIDAWIKTYDKHAKQVIKMLSNAGLDIEIKQVLGVPRSNTNISGFKEDSEKIIQKASIIIDNSNPDLYKIFDMRNSRWERKKSLFSTVHNNAVGELEIFAMYYQARSQGKALYQTVFETFVVRDDPDANDLNDKKKEACAKVASYIADTMLPVIRILGQQL